MNNLKGMRRQNQRIRRTGNFIRMTVQISSPKAKCAFRKNIVPTF